ncbi:MAG: hypothetical protein HY360_26810 [Verrucomicrobia bacterium]|nr:hypothetical protein [Verrucomicrobiota bacterium]
MFTDISIVYAKPNIAREKVTRYLLVPQARGDKSGFLEHAGYPLEDYNQLLRDLRLQLPLDAAATKSNKLGQYYEIRAWFKVHGSGVHG